MIAIHVRSGSFSDRWIVECERRQLPYTCVDIFATDFIDSIRSAGASHLLVHVGMYDARVALAARSIMEACRALGVIVFPSHADFWHFDDKIAQAYLFSAHSINSPSTLVLYDEVEAIKWLETTRLPVVFKLASGAGAVNVRLVTSPSLGRRMIRKMFGGGYSATNAAVRDISTRLRAERARGSFVSTMLRGIKSLVRMMKLRRSVPKERGYVIFQEFVPGNEHDIRVTIVGSRAFAFKRLVRPGDFRASGSGRIVYDSNEIDIKFITEAFDAASKLGTTCIALDYITAEDGSPLLVEMSFAFKAEAVYACPGYWDRELHWHEGHYWPQDLVLDDLLISTSP